MAMVSSTQRRIGHSSVANQQQLGADIAHIVCLFADRREN
jgi:hypothetical protein